MLLPVTTITTITLAVWYVVLTMRVIDARRASGVAIGDGGDELLVRRMRGQANFAENVPITLLVLLVAEMQPVTVFADAFPIALAGAALAFTAGRVLHGYAFCFTEQWVFGRMWGMLLTFAAQIALIVLAVFASLA